MKKVLSLVLAIAMVLSSMSFAFAGTFEDVEDAATAKAVDALSSLGVVKGNPDGTFKPENSITRAEMAAMLVRALGHSDLAAGSTSSFKDAKGKWYDGEVAVAQSLGLTNGYPDGTFKGENEVSYTESITMIMRALGYNNRAVNSNRTETYNATSYKTAAARLGVLSNVVLGTGAANRGDVAKMLYNSLEVQVVIPDENGNPVLQWIVAPNVAQGVTGQSRTLLDDVAVRDEIVIGTDDLFGAHVADVSAYLGEKVIAYTNNDGEILFVKGSISSANKVVTKGTISATSTVANTFKVKVSSTVSKDFEVTSSQAIDLIVNNVKTSETGATAVAKLANIINRVHSIKVVTGTKLTIVVEDITNTFQANAEYVSGKTKFQGINLPTKDGKVNTDRIVFVGAASSLEDIEIGDVVQACVANSSDNIKFYVTRDTVEGKVTEEMSAGQKYAIDGTVYYLNGTSGTIDSLSLGSEGTFYLDKDGDIAYSSTVNTTISNYGIITAIDSGLTGESFSKVSVIKAPRVKMVGTDGKEKIYDVVVSLNDAPLTTTQAANGFNVTGLTTSGQFNINLKTELTTAGVVKTSTTAATTEYLVKYVLNDDGKIIKVEKATLANYDTTTKKSAKFLANDNTIVLGRDNTGKYSVIDVEKLTDGTIGYQVITNASNFGWDFAVITTGINAANTVKTFAAVKSISNVLNSAGTATVQKVTAWVDGVEVSYITNTNSAVDTTNKNKVVSLVFNSAGLVTGVEALAAGRLADNVTASAINSNGTVIKVDGAIEDYYTLSANVVVYREPASSAGTVSVGDLNDIRITNGTAKVSLYDKDNDGVIDVIYMHK